MSPKSSKSFCNASAAVVSTGQTTPEPVPPTNGVTAREAAGVRQVYFGRLGCRQEVPWYAREDLAPGDEIPGPALIVEPQTSTYMGPGFEGRVDGAGNLILTRRAQARNAQARNAQEGA